MTSINIDKNYKLSEIEDIAAEINTHLISHEKPFILSIKGDLGAGKTELTRNLLRHLGLPKAVPVQSPTFSYFNEYQIGSKAYLHMDLYRCDGTLDFLDLLGKDPSYYSGFYIEWYEQMPNLRQDLGCPSHQIYLSSIVDSPLSRHLFFEKL